MADLFRARNHTISFIGQASPAPDGKYSSLTLTHTIPSAFRPQYLSAHVADNSKLIVEALVLGMCHLLPQGSWFGGMLALQYSTARWLEAFERGTKEKGESAMFQSVDFEPFLKPFGLYQEVGTAGQHMSLTVRNYTKDAEAFCFNVHGLIAIAAPKPSTPTKPFNLDLDSVLGDEPPDPPPTGPRARRCPKCMAAPGVACFGQRKDHYHAQR